MLLIVGGAALAGLLALRLDSREPVLVMTQDVPAGTKITADMLGTTRVASEGLKLIPESDASTVLETYARTPLSNGQLLDTTVIVSSPPIDADQVQVGVTLKAGQIPVGLQSGDEVRLVRLGDGGGAVQPLAVGLVLEAGTSESDGGLSGGVSSSEASIIVPARAADAVIDASGNDLLGIALLRRGVAIDDAQLQVLGATP